MNIKKVTIGAVSVVAALGLAAVLLSDREQVVASEVFTASEDLEIATFAGGCFWCVEKDFETLPGVAEAISGYSGGEIENPTYKQVARGLTKHTEAVRVHYDPNVISYDKLLEAFWRQINPTDNNGQFVDRGQQYRPVIFVHNETQASIAEASKQALIDSNRYSDPITIPIEPAQAFYQAEDYHQDFYKKSPGGYKTYRYGSGRDQYLKRIWGDDLELDLTAEKKKLTQLKQAKTEKPKEAFVKPSDAQLREQLSEIAYKVTQQDGTERPFDNPYHDEKRPGIYVDVVSGEPLFSSLDKFDSGTGWPSFVKPLVDENIKTKTDFKLLLPRTEVRSAQADSHLGHVFKDGPAPTGLRYCMNSAAMRFIPKEDLEGEGYGQYVELFDS